MEQVLAIVVSMAILGLAVATAGHALLYKRDGRSVILWVGFIILLPLVGAALYWLVAVNRIRRRASALRPQPAGHGDHMPPTPAAEPPPSLASLAALCDRVSPFPLAAGNAITPLENGEVAFPAMLEAIKGAERSVALATYIFDDDPLGQRFLDALAAAVERGVEVRVLVDAVGQRYSRRSMVSLLRTAGVPAAAFMPVRAPRDLASFNLRNHRKLLITDGRKAFTGGMNLRVGHLTETAGVKPIRDLQCMVHGPVVAQLMQVFADDWSFTTQEVLLGETWFPPQRAVDGIPARAIPDGPDEHFEALKLVLQGAISEARSSVAIVTPYFLPDATLISALNTAALRGVDVHIILPSQNNLRLVQWASHAQYWQLLERGCRIWHSPPPFDHSKLLLVDDEWALVGSTNWDPRSLRLNFELNMECYSPALGLTLRDWFERRRAESTEITQARLDEQPFLLRLRDSTARLLIPLL